MYKLGSKSLSKLEGVHPDLVRVVKRAIELTKQDFTVIEGMRSYDRQRLLVRQGASQTLNSRHLTGHAVDIAPWVNGTISWEAKDFEPLGAAMLAAAKELGVEITWGKTFKKLVDCPHFELTRSKYPAK